MRITFFAALPPPVSGQSLSSQVLLRELSKSHSIDVVNLSKQSFVPGVNSVGRLVEVGRILGKVWRKRKTAGTIYFTISESFAGNMKDLLVYGLCRAQLSRMVVHLQGGAGLREILHGRPHFAARINRYFLQRLGGVVVEGQTQSNMFRGLVPEQRIHIVPNFAEAHLFAEPGQIAEKFQTLSPLKILFLSNLIRGKGYEELLEAYRKLDDNTQSRVLLDFAGGFETPEQKADFLEKIRRLKHVNYHGIVEGEVKARLYKSAHVFCLPTYYPYEGQPLSILEAYASGCAVVTTNHSGIRDVFTPGVNGYEVEKKSPASLVAAITRIIDESDGLEKMALTNRKTAEEKYTVDRFVRAVSQVISNVGEEMGARRSRSS